LKTESGKNPAGWTYPPPDFPSSGKCPFFAQRKIAQKKDHHFQNRPAQDFSEKE